MKKHLSHARGVVNTARWIVLSLSLVCLLVGCTAAQVSTVVTDIGIYVQQAEPIIVALIPVITALTSDSKDPSAASLNSFAAVATADLDALTTLCNDYTAHPSTSVYTQIQMLVDKLVNESDASLLQVLAIKDEGTRRQVQLAVASFDALIHTMDGFVQTTQSAGTVAAKAQGRAVKLRDVARYWNTDDKTRISQAFGKEYGSLIRDEAELGF